MRSVKKGSKKFRKILIYDEQTEIPHNINKFATNTETIIGIETSRFLNSAWNFSGYCNSFRVFLFKFYNNTLGYNYMLSRFINNVEPYCTFCATVRNVDLEPETPLHIFYTCPCVEPILNRLKNNILQDNEELRRTDFFVRHNFENSQKNLALFVIWSKTRYYIWEQKLRKSLPVYDELVAFLEMEIKLMCRVSTTFRNTWQQSGLHNRLFLF